MTTQQWWLVTLPTSDLARAWGSRLRKNNIRYVVNSAVELYVPTDSSHSEKFLADNRARFRLSWIKAEEPAIGTTTRCGIAFASVRRGGRHENRCNACRRLRSNDTARSAPPAKAGGFDAERYAQVDRATVPAYAQVNREAKTGNEANQQQPVAQVDGATIEFVENAIDSIHATPLDTAIRGLEGDRDHALELATQLDDIVTALRQMTTVRQQLAELEVAATAHRATLASLMKNDWPVTAGGEG